ncbi:MAG TPA: 2OG-Fe(II) oxygenase [Hanamia sp.]|nr:2OG-Fe(II) oxygenase [Hanamia sp.]
MKAVILAAGIASRLRPLTDDMPKCLLKVGEKNILELTIDNIIANNIDEVIIVTGYLQEKIKLFVSNNYPGLNVTYIYNELYESTNNIYSLWLANESLTGEEMLLMDSDIIFDKEIITKLLASEYESCLALKRHDVQDEEIKVKADENGRVLEIGKTVKLQDAIGESIGIEKFGVETLKCYTGINSYEFHYTLYVRGAFYKKHIDRFQNNDSRKFSMIMYLNIDWIPEDGGELSIHHEAGLQNISPMNGKVLFFKSNELEHEVLMTHKNRMSITGWLKC